MIVKPMIRSNICINAHPLGCAKEVEHQIAYVQSKNAARGRKPGAPVSGGTHKAGPVKAALVLGCSTGYGLASRITATFGYLGGSATTLTYFLYDAGFTRNEFGYASAAALVLFLLSILITAAQLGLQRYFVYYESEAG